MKNFSISFIKTLVLIAILGAFTGCMQRVAVQKTRTVSTVSMKLNKAESSKSTKDGITIKAKAIHPDNVKQYAGLSTKMDYWYYARSYSGKRMDLDHDGYYDTTTRSLDFDLVSYPAFEVKITNSTDHVLKFSNAVIVVEDSAGNSYDALQKSDLLSYLMENIDAHLGDTTKYNVTKETIKSLRNKLKKIRLVDNNLKVLPGKTVKAYVILNYGHYLPADMKDFIIEIPKFTLELYELPIAVNQAGKVTKTTNFDFVYDVKVTDKEEKYTTYIYK